MGLLDRMAEAERAAQEEALKRAALAQSQENARIQAEKDRVIRLNQVIIPSYIKDTEAIIRLLGTLPPEDYDAYLREASRFTQYDVTVAIYTSPKPDLESKHPLRQKLEDLTQQRDEAFINARLSPTKLHKGIQTARYTSDEKSFDPSQCQFGDGPIKVKPTGILERLFVGERTLDEPKLPGVGIRFSESYSSEHTQYRSISHITSTSSIYVRISAGPETIVTDGRSQQRFHLRGLRQLDDAIEIGLQNPNYKASSWSEPWSPSYD